MRTMHRSKRIHRRPLLTIAIGLFLCAILTSCGGGFFQHPTVSTMYLNPATATVAPGNTAQFEAYGIYSDGSQKKINPDLVTWSSSDSTVASVSSPGGLVTGIGAGSATITAMATITVPGRGCQVEVSLSPVIQVQNVCTSASTETLTATVNVNVMTGNVTRAVITTTPASTLFQSTATISGSAAGLQFYAYANGDASNDVTQAVTWTSSNPSVAIISSGQPSGNGVVTGVAAGTTNITAAITNSSGHVVNSQTIVLTVQ